MKKLVVVFLILISALSLGAYAGIGYVENNVNSDLTIRDSISNQIAIVNLDEGILNSNGQRIYYSDIFLKSLDNNYCVESASGALKGLESNMYSAVITFPSNTSANIESLNSTNPEVLNIEYSINSNLAENKFIEISELINNFQNEISNNLSYLYVSSIITELHKAQDDIEDLYSNNAEILSEINSLQLNDYITDLDITMMPSVEMNLKNMSPEEYVGSANTITNQVDDAYKEAYQAEYDRILNQLSEIEVKISEYSTWDASVSVFKTELQDYYNVLQNYCTDMNTSYQYLNAYKGSLTDWNTALQSYKQAIDVYAGSANEIYTSLSDWYNSLSEYSKGLISAVNKDIDIINVTISDTNTIISNYNQNIDSLNLSIDNINNSIKAINDLVKSYEDENSELLDSVNNKNQEIKDLFDGYNLELQQLLRDYEEVKSQYDANLEIYLNDSASLLQHCVEGECSIDSDTWQILQQYKNGLDDLSIELDILYERIVSFSVTNPMNDDSSEADNKQDSDENQDAENEEDNEGIPDLEPTDIPTVTPLPTLEYLPSVNPISSLNKLIEKDYPVPTCSISSIVFPTLNYEVDDKNYNSKKNPDCNYVDVVNDSLKFIPVSAKEIETKDVNTWFDDNAPLSTSGLSGYVANLQDVVDDVNPSNYLATTNNSYAYSINRILSQYGVLNNSIATDFLNNQTQNMQEINGAYSAYRTYVGTMKSDLETTFQNENESFTNMVEDSVTNIAEINNNSNELLGDFSTRMPNSRNGADINTAVVDVMISPVQLVNSSSLLEAQAISYTPIKSTLKIVGLTTLAVGLLLLSISMILDKRKKVK